MILSIIIPAYSESDNIKATIEEVLAITSKISDIEKAKVIVIDDHSTDNTYDIVNNINDQGISCLRLSRRSGSHTALRAGLMQSNGDAALCISADGQDNPSCLEDMISKWNSGHKIVWALRKHRKAESYFSRFMSQMFYRILFWLTKSSQPTIDLSRADFYLLDRVVVKAINSCQERNTSLFGLVSWLGFRQGFVEYDRRERKSGLSKWNIKSRFRLAKDWIIAFSGLPLKLMTVAGFIVALFGFSYALFLIINAVVIGKSVQGWSSIMVVILFLGGLQMIMFGIAGEYLWRNLEESRKRPLYFIEKSTLENNKE